MERRTLVVNPGLALSRRWKSQTCRHREQVATIPYAQ